MGGGAGGELSSYHGRARTGETAERGAGVGDSVVESARGRIPRRVRIRVERKG